MNRLKLLRETKGISQKEMAKHIEKSPQAYNFYENGRREPDIATLKKLADYFSTSIDYLVEYIPQNNQELPSVSGDELDLIKKYRFLDEARQEAIRDLIDTSYARALTAQKNTTELVS